jgi:hypothetical protein
MSSLTLVRHYHFILSSDHFIQLKVDRFVVFRIFLHTRGPNLVPAIIISSPVQGRKVHPM